MGEVREMLGVRWYRALEAFMGLSFYFERMELEHVYYHITMAVLTCLLLGEEVWVLLESQEIQDTKQE